MSLRLGATTSVQLGSCKDSNEPNTDLPVGGHDDTTQEQQV